MVGHGSPSRVYGKLEERIGMTPRQFKKQEVSCSYALADTPLGKLLIAATDREFALSIRFLQADVVKALKMNS